MHMSINMIPCHLFGLLRFALFWHWYTLTFVPSLVVSLSLKETGEVRVHCLSCSVAHCFKGFWGNAVEARCLSLLQFVDGVLSSLKVTSVSMAVRLSFCSMRSRTVSSTSTGMWLFRTLWMCMLKMDIFFFGISG